MCNHEYEVVESFKFDESMSTLSPDQIETMLNDDRIGSDVRKWMYNKKLKLKNQLFILPINKKKTKN